MGTCWSEEEADDLTTRTNLVFSAGKTNLGLHPRRQLTGFSRFDYAPFFNFCRREFGTGTRDYSFVDVFSLPIDQVAAMVAHLNRNRDPKGSLEAAERKELLAICRLARNAMKEKKLTLRWLHGPFAFRHVGCNHSDYNYFNCDLAPAL
jgi:hypothetical protein